jgi:choline kinase
MIDLYLCPSCLFIELAEDDLDKCPKCNSPLLFVDADPEFKHLIVDVLNDHGCEVASAVVIILALTHPLYVQVRKDEKVKLSKDELVTILKKNKSYTIKGIKVLRDVFTPQNVEEFEKQLSSIFE